MQDALTEWERKLLALARITWEYGEGEITFTVYARPPANIRHWQIKGGPIDRGKEEGKENGNKEKQD